MKKCLLVLLMMGLVLSSTPVWAKDGFYIGGELGIAMAPDLDVESWDNDVPTQCDGFINNDGSGGQLVPPLRNCAQSSRDDFSWLQKFDGGSGILAGAALGYRMGSFRVEGEYFYRSTTYDDSYNVPLGENVQGGKENELRFIEASVDDVLSHNFFANLYYDYRSDSKFTPYVGFGVGFSRVSLDFL